MVFALASTILIRATLPTSHACCLQHVQSLEAALPYLLLLFSGKAIPTKDAYTWSVQRIKAAFRQGWPANARWQVSALFAGTDGGLHVCRLLMFVHVWDLLHTCLSGIITYEVCALPCVAVLWAQCTNHAALIAVGTHITLEIPTMLEALHHGMHTTGNPTEIPHLLEEIHTETAVATDPEVAAHLVADTMTRC